MISISDSLRNLIQSYGDFLIEDAAKQCRIFYPAKRTQCPNCHYDSQSQRSSGLYKNGGPYPFSGGVCPYCQGAGFKEETTSELLSLKIDWFNLHEQVDIAKSFANENIPNESIALPYGILRTKGFMRDKAKILRAEKMVAQIPVEGLERQVFYKITEPIDNYNVVPNRYFLCFWARHGSN